MTAVINPRPSSSDDFTSDRDAKIELLKNIEDHVARVSDAWILAKDEGVWTVSDDKSVRLYLRREGTDQYWPSIHQLMPVPATCILYHEESRRLLVGLLNGHVFDYEVEEDLNSMKELRHFTLHAGPVSGLHLALTSEQIFSCARDKAILWHCSATGIRQGGFTIDSSCTCMIVDLPAEAIFVGDYGGNIHVLRFVDGAAHEVSKLSAHTGTITSLAYDSQRQWLFSGSSDRLVIMWDIGGKQGKAYELNGHTTRVSRLFYASRSKRLFSADETGRLVIWDMTENRKETPAWANSDTCQLCDAPFFWNVQAMWQKKVVGLRQHHCRICGKAVCSSCCSAKTTYPIMGFEIAVRICKQCNEDIKSHPSSHDMRSRALSSELRTGVTALHVEEATGRMVTVGQNRVVALWNVNPVLSS